MVFLDHQIVLFRNRVRFFFTKSATMKFILFLTITISINYISFTIIIHNIFRYGEGRGDTLVSNIFIAVFRNRTGLLRNRIGLFRNRIGLLRNRISLFRNRISLFRNRIGLFRNWASLFSNKMLGEKKIYHPDPPHNGK